MSKPTTDVFAIPRQADSLTRIADGANEAELLELAHHATAAQVEKLVRAYRSVIGRTERLAERKQAVANHAARDCRSWKVPSCYRRSTPRWTRNTQREFVIQGTTQPMTLPRKRSPRAKPAAPNSRTGTGFCLDTGSRERGTGVYALGIQSVMKSGGRPRITLLLKRRPMNRNKYTVPGITPELPRNYQPSFLTIFPITIRDIDNR